MSNDNQPILDNYIRKNKRSDNPNYKGWYLSQALNSGSNPLIEPYLPLYISFLGASIPNWFYYRNLFFN